MKVSAIELVRLLDSAVRMAAHDWVESAHIEEVKMALPLRVVESLEVTLTPAEESAGSASGEETSRVPVSIAEGVQEILAPVPKKRRRRSKRRSRLLSASTRALTVADSSVIRERLNGVDPKTPKYRKLRDDIGRELGLTRIQVGLGAAKLKSDTSAQAEVSAKGGKAKRRAKKAQTVAQ